MKEEELMEGLKMLGECNEKFTEIYELLNRREDLRQEVFSKYTLVELVIKIETGGLL
ncbi:TPA: hypothetical protein U2C19_000935 [Streptococcus suis]|nr:hypothetical protein [Streptococcus suis]HEM6278484.1 hypothetical protein [Streptococcus suis]